MKKLVYTYCNYDTFFKISEGSFKLSDLRRSNDSKELKERCSKDVLVLRELYKSAANVYKDNLEAYSYMNRLADVIEKTASESFAFGCCFSELKDNKDMWCEYGNHGNGVAIGFDIKSLELIADEEVIEFGQVKYLAKNASVFIGDIMQIAGDKSGEKAYNYFKENILTKNRNYKDEKEWRLFKMIIDVKSDMKLEPLYIKFKPIIIEKIVIGSDCTNEEEETIISSLDSRVDVSYSQVPVKRSENRNK